MSFTAATASLQKRAEEAIRYALEYKIGEWGTLYATSTAQPNLIVADISITGGTVPTQGESIWVGLASYTVASITHSSSFPAGWRITTIEDVTATAGDPVRINYSANVRRSDDMRSDEGVSPLVVVHIVNLKEAWACAPDFAGSLVVGIDHITNTITAEDGSEITEETNTDQSEAHQLLCQRISDILADVQTIADLTMFAAVRPVSDLTIKGLYDSEEPGGGFDGSRHVFEIRKRILVSRTDDF